MLRMPCCNGHTATSMLQQLYDVAADAAQLTNLCGTTAPAKLEALRAQLRREFGCKASSCS